MTSDRGRIVMAGLVLAAMGLMLYFPARVFECDAVIYASGGLHRDLVQSTDAGHLSWGGIELMVAPLCRSTSPPLNSMYLLCYLSIAAALAGSWLVFRLLARQLRLPGTTAALLAGMLLFSYSYWHFGLQAEPHALHVLALVVVLFTSWTLLARPSRARALVAGLTLGVTTLLHQTTILLVPGVLVALHVALRRRGPWISILSWFTGAYFVSAVVPYLMVGWFVRGFRSYDAFRNWILGVSLRGAWGHWRATSPVAAVIGIVRSLTGSHYLLHLPVMRNLALRLFPHASWEDEFALAAAVPAWLRVVLAPVQVAVMAGVVWLFVHAVARLRQVWASAPAFAVLLVAWLVIWGGFMTWWAPERAEFWVAFWLLLLVLMAPAVAARARPRVLALLLAGLVVVNFLGSILPQSMRRLESATRVAVAIDAAVTRGDVLLSDLPLARRAGRYVYSLEMVPLPEVRDRTATMVDSLLRAVSQRGRTVYWVGSDGGLPAVLADLVQAGDPVPVRAEVTVLPLRPVVDRSGRWLTSR